ncbi:2OG-Fe(II) oxygenase [bacterium]|nr:2OG-Fe(II) oxygenase [bacterium]
MRPIFADPRYAELALSLGKSYAEAEPFPHVVIEDFLPGDVLEQVLLEFPRPDQLDWHKFDAKHEKKLATEDATQIPPFARELLQEFNAQACLRFLEKLTGIENLIPDPHFEGGGLHQIVPGGFLGVHADFNYHPTYKLDRRINLLLYINKGWKDEWNGHLELWDRTMSRCVKKLAPVFNRCVIFSTTDDAYHGHPEKLLCPEGTTRKSLALYYYTRGRPGDEGFVTHSTLFRRRPKDARTFLGRAINGFRYFVARVFRKLAYWTEPDRTA